MFKVPPKRFTPRNKKRMGMLEFQGNTLHDSLDVHVDKRHAVVRILLHDGHEGEVAVDLAQHDGPLRVVQDHAALGPVAGDLVLDLGVPRLGLEALPLAVRARPGAVDLGDVDDDIDVVGADLVRGHVGRGRVGGDHVEEVGLLETARAAEVGEHGLEGAELGDELLDDLGEGLKDGVVVDGRQVEGDGGVLEAVVRELVLDADGDVALDVELVVVGEAVDLVDEDLNVDVWVEALEVKNCGVEPRHGLEVVVLRVDDPDEGTDLAKNGVHVKVGVLEEVDLAGEVPDLVVHERSGRCQWLVLQSWVI
ncbi:hypothetical protein ColLi_09416 [Colletotrichum liriopes]|uniref:Uncharacterized protein n=1 Tax=Colletotrichum liriopes TaxID=708192 RepID=A0AA37LWI6_9PEZI|nr:hypothetical protein ColLi_09416 [Colletotrichum liriopes]